MRLVEDRLAPFSRFKAEHTRAIDLRVTRDGTTSTESTLARLGDAACTARVNFPTDAAAREAVRRTIARGREEEGAPVDSVVVRIRRIDLIHDPLRLRAIPLASGAAP